MREPRNQYVALAVAIVLGYLLLLSPQPWIEGYVRENGPVEDAGFLALFVGGCLFLVCFRRSRGREGWGRGKRLFLLGLGLALLVGAGEEINWGQQWFGMGTPKPIAKHNYQQELSAHNLSAFGGWGIWRAFEIFTLLFAVVVPLAARFSDRARDFFQRYVPIIIPLWWAGLLLLMELMIAAWAVAFDLAPGLWHGSGAMFQGRSEVTESTISLLYAVLAFHLLRTEFSRVPEPARPRAPAIPNPIQPPRRA